MAMAQGITCVTISQRLSLPEFHVADLRMGENNAEGYSLVEIDAESAAVANLRDGRKVAEEEVRQRLIETALICALPPTSEIAGFTTLFRPRRQCTCFLQRTRTSRKPIIKHFLRRLTPFPCRLTLALLLQWRGKVQVRGVWWGEGS